MGAFCGWLQTNGITAEVVEDLMQHGFGVMNEPACPKESAKSSHGHQGGSGRQTDHSKVWRAAGSAGPNLPDAVVVGLAQGSSFWNEVGTLRTLGSPAAHLPAKGSSSNCGPGTSSESGSEQGMFGLDVLEEPEIPLGNCSVMDAEYVVGGMLMGP